MRHGIVEGEPGIYPDPFARLMRAIGRLFGHRARRAADDRESPPPPGAPPDTPTPEQP
ncbi:MAG TPA: hypothetical protein VHS52_07365 [Acidimicrobiales bacterium]|nr:hypothetical protein [Acidimicrobiales bacterium]